MSVARKLALELMRGYAARARSAVLEAEARTSPGSDLAIILRNCERFLDAAAEEIEMFEAEVARLTGERDEAREGRAILQRECDEWQERYDRLQEEAGRARDAATHWYHMAGEAEPEGRKPAAIVLVGYGLDTRVHGFEVYDEAHAWLTANGNNFRTITDTRDGTI